MPLKSHTHDSISLVAADNVDTDESHGKNALNCAVCK